LYTFAVTIILVNSDDDGEPAKSTKKKGNEKRWKAIEMNMSCKYFFFET